MSGNAAIYFKKPFVFVISLKFTILSPCLGLRQRRMLQTVQNTSFNNSLIASKIGGFPELPSSKQNKLRPESLQQQLGIKRRS